MQVKIWHVPSKSNKLQKPRDELSTMIVVSLSELHKDHQTDQTTVIEDKTQYEGVTEINAE